jgi:alkaline phosphatase
MTRRTQSSLTPLLLVIGLLLVPMFSGCATMGATDASSGKAKNVILLIGDGMGPSHFGAAWLYSNRVLKKDLQMVQVMNTGRRLSVTIRRMPS